MFGTNIRRFPLFLTPIVRQQTNIATHLKNTNNDGVIKTSNTLNQCGIPSERTIRDKHLSNITVTSFYSQTAIEQLAVKVIDQKTCP